MAVITNLLSLLVPPRCVVCGAASTVSEPLCRACAAALERLPVPPSVAFSGIDAAWAAMPHDGVARELVAALKFRRLLAAADPIADLIAKRAPGGLLCGALVAVPAAPSRFLRRGFDPAEEIAVRLAAATALETRAPLRRGNAPPQVGRSRSSRLSDPPKIHPVEAAPRTALLIDDVQTTGATLQACAEALRMAGAERIAAVTFARTLE